LLCSERLVHLDTERHAVYVIVPLNGYQTSLGFYPEADAVTAALALDTLKQLFSHTAAPSAADPRYLVSVQENGTLLDIAGPTGITANTEAYAVAPDGTHYLLDTANDDLYTVDPASGVATLWSHYAYDFVDGDFVITQDDKLVYLNATDGQIVLIDLGDNSVNVDVALKLPTNAYLNGTVVVGEDLAFNQNYTGLALLQLSGDDTYFAFDAANSLLYRFTLDPFAFAKVDAGTNTMFSFGYGDAASCPLDEIVPPVTPPVTPPTTPPSTPPTTPPSTPTDPSGPTANTGTGVNRLCIKIKKGLFARPFSFGSHF